MDGRRNVRKQNRNLVQISWDSIGRPGKDLADRADRRCVPLALWVGEVGVHVQTRHDVGEAGGKVTPGRLGTTEAVRSGQVGTLEGSARFSGILYINIWNVY